MPTTGTDLKVERVIANVKIVDLAAQMKLSRQAVWGLERAAVVDADRANQYRTALETLRNDIPEEATA